MFAKIGVLYSNSPVGGSADHEHALSMLRVFEVRPFTNSTENPAAFIQENAFDADP